VTDSDRALLGELRKYLLQLHKTLIDWQRADYERVRGRLQTTQLLNVMFNDPEFAWLRSMSGLIVRIDEALDPPPLARQQASSGEASPKRPPAAKVGVKPPKEPIESGPLVAAARDLIAPEAGSAYAQRYHAALQELPEAVLAHRDLVILLKLQRPASNA
jgi:hypothetical protein